MCCFVLLIPTPEEYRVPRVNPGVTAVKTAVRDTLGPEAFSGDRYKGTRGDQKMANVSGGSFGATLDEDSGPCQSDQCNAYSQAQGLSALRRGKGVVGIFLSAINFGSPAAVGGSDNPAQADDAEQPTDTQDEDTPSEAEHRREQEQEQARALRDAAGLEWTDGQDHTQEDGSEAEKEGVSLGEAGEGEGSEEEPWSEGEIELPWEDNRRFNSTGIPQVFTYTRV